jgi:hypothetical protein
VTAVAVWNHQPNADELLADRLARGWKPTPTSVNGHEEILGHAACAIHSPAFSAAAASDASSNRSK